jgi:hypothetical protein
MRDVMDKEAEVEDDMRVREAEVEADFGDDLVAASLALTFKTIGLGCVERARCKRVDELREEWRIMLFTKKKRVVAANSCMMRANSASRRQHG